MLRQLQRVPPGSAYYPMAMDLTARTMGIQWPPAPVYTCIHCNTPARISASNTLLPCTTCFHNAGAYQPPRQPYYRAPPRIQQVKPWTPRNIDAPAPLRTPTPPSLQRPEQAVTPLPSSQSSPVSPPDTPAAQAASLLATINTMLVDAVAAVAELTKDLDHGATPKRLDWERAPTITIDITSAPRCPSCHTTDHAFRIMGQLKYVCRSGRHGCDSASF